METSQDESDILYRYRIKKSTADNKCSKPYFEVTCFVRNKQYATLNKIGTKLI